MSGFSKRNNDIRRRDKPKDVFITPRDLALKHINIVKEKSNDDDVWIDPCRYNEGGSYYSQIPTEKKDWCEITEGRDFFEYDGHATIVIQNPPYSMITKWIDKCININPRIISLLIGVNNLTAKRIETFNKAGYGITHLTMLKVRQWFGETYIVVFEKDKDNIINIDRKQYYMVPVEKKEEDK
jgi:hypothetical protein